MMEDPNHNELGESWIDQFLQYSENFPSPYVFRKWSAISAVACALERRVKVQRFNERDLYPNLYIMLIGKPGSGKTTAMTTVYDLLAAAGLKLAPRSTTAAALYDSVGKALRHVNHEKGMMIYSSLACVVDELAVWMPMYDSALHGILCSLWDNPVKHDEGRRTKESKPLENPQLNMLVGVQPAYLNTILPPSAHEMGLVTRCLLVYCAERLAYDLTFGETDVENHSQKFDHLLAGLKRISTMLGVMKFTEGAKKLLKHFHKEAPGLEDLKFEHYNNRRIVSIAKLGMIASAAQGETYSITEAHLQWAIGSLKHIELHMPEVYKEMRKPETSKVLAEVFDWAYRKYLADQTPIPEHRLLHALEAKIPIRDLAAMLKALVDLRMFKVVEGAYGRCYVPVSEKNRL